MAQIKEAWVLVPTQNTITKSILTDRLNNLIVHLANKFNSPVRTVDTEVHTLVTTFNPTTGEMDSLTTKKLMGWQVFVIAENSNENREMLRNIAKQFMLSNSLSRIQFAYPNGEVEVLTPEEEEEVTESTT